MFDSTTTCAQPCVFSMVRVGGCRPRGCGYVRQSLWGRLSVLASALVLGLGIGAGGAGAQGVQIPGVPVPKPATGPATGPAVPPAAKAAPVQTAPAAPSAAQPADTAAAPAPSVEAQSAAQPAAPQKPTPPPPLVIPEDITQPVIKLTAEITAAEAALEQAKDREEELIRMRGEIQQIAQSARTFIDQLKPRLDATKQQIAALGAAPGKDAPPEPDAVAHQRFKLSGLAGATDGAIRTSELIAERCSQLTDRLQQHQRDLFTRSLLKRTPSPILPTLWIQLMQESRRGLEDIARLASNWWSIAEGHRLELLGVVTGLIGLWFLLSFLARFAISRYRNANPGEQGFFARAATAAWAAPVLALPSIICMGLLYLAFDHLDLLYLGMRRLLLAALHAVISFSVVASLAAALLTPRRPEWRLFQLSDSSAARIRWLILLIASVYAIDLVLKELNNIIFAPLSVTIAQSFLAGVSFAALLIALLLTPFIVQRQRVVAAAAVTAADEIGHADDLPPQRAVSTLEPRWLKLPLWLVAIGIIGAALLGYVSLARFLSGQVIITGSILVALALLQLAVRAMADDMVADEKASAGWLKANLGLEQHRRRQIAFLFTVFVSGGLVLLALPLILLQWGFDFDVVTGWFKAALFGFKVGGIEISLTRVIMALVILGGGYFGTRMLQRSLEKSVLVPPRMDAGIANSIKTAIGYAGIGASVLLAASYAGLDFTNLAIVAGALSVGIGFGLQSVINNFVSGLILLVERPVKVGDWIVVGSDEGYVRRISVRSTEIETFDRSSVIIPNAELIQGRVKNWTLRDAVGRVRIPVGIGYDSDPEKARAILLKLAEEQAGVLRYPPANVAFVGFGGNSIDMALNLFVADVNGGGPIKTEVAFKILKAFREAGIEMPNPQYDIHLRDLDPVRDMLTRAIEERRQQQQTRPTEVRPQEAEDNTTAPLRQAAPLKTA
jgi:potassium-dependent mechanosensitive channel